MKVINGCCIYCPKNIFPYKDGEVKNKEVLDADFSPRIIFWHTKCNKGELLVSPCKNEIKNVRE